MSAVQSNQKIAQTLHTVLKTKGHTLPLGHVYEALSQLAGHDNWNIAKAKEVDFSKHLVKENENESAIAAVESICKVAMDEAASHPRIKHYTDNELMQLTKDEIIKQILTLQKEEQFYKENAAKVKAAKKLIATLKK